MAEVRLVDLKDAPEEGTAKLIAFEHPVTYMDYEVALFQVNGKFYSLLNECKRCCGYLGEGKLEGMYVICPRDDTPWNVRTGLCKFDKSQSTSSYKVQTKDDGLVIII
jgi:nitrite reductase/ring-hydroxylating ferredoxin subunit|tara:strand:+ start:319 stop:642 length:324 start_codon:yes stop_codon:yes gene_type:complete